VPTSTTVRPSARSSRACRRSARGATDEVADQTSGDLLNDRDLEALEGRLLATVAIRSGKHLYLVAVVNYGTEKVDGPVELQGLAKGVKKPRPRT
jgi:hypothetical protein